MRVLFQYSQYSLLEIVQRTDYRLGERQLTLNHKNDKRLFD